MDPLVVSQPGHLLWGKDESNQEVAGGDQVFHQVAEGLLLGGSPFTSSSPSSNLPRRDVTWFLSKTAHFSRL
jgi:hypothetical protein